MSIYQEIILDHYHYPRNSGVVNNADADISVQNTSCGDSVRLTLKVHGKTIEDIALQVNGCAISTASASILSEHVRGKRIDQVRNMNSQDVLKLLKIDLSPNRLKCAILPLEALSKAVNELQS